MLAQRGGREHELAGLLEEVVHMAVGQGVAFGLVKLITRLAFCLRLVYWFIFLRPRPAAVPEAVPAPLAAAVDARLDLARTSAK